ncbi:MAG: carboxypeptidase-like regulatory domain-containing protein [Planctomycetaceae bacterium]|nr:carboxypeptidase-like regulatory domain-containing protein [Planctomycetaceae bacterium]
MKQWTLVLLLFANVLVPVIGCGSKGQLSGLVPGHGVVFYDDTPLASATVSFTPTQENGTTRGASATTDEKGAFQLMTLNRNDGVQPGEYVVTVTKVERPPPVDEETLRKAMSGEIPAPPLDTKIKHLINPKYADAKTSGVNVTIGPKGDQQIEIRLEK